MSSNSQFAVAIHILGVLSFLEKRGTPLVSSSMIARSVNTNPVVIRNTLRALKKARLVASREGKGGGVRITRKSSEISLLEIYQAVEKGSLLKASPREPFAPCPVSRGIKSAFLDVSSGVDKAVAAYLKGRTLASVLAKLSR